MIDASDQFQVTDRDKRSARWLQSGYPTVSHLIDYFREIIMVRGVGSFITMAVLLLAAGCMAGYIYGGIPWSTYSAVGRAVKAFWWAAGLLFIAGIVYRIVFNRLSGVCGILFCVAIAVALVLTGFHYAVGGNAWWR